MMRLDLRRPLVPCSSPNLNHKRLSRSRKIRASMVGFRKRLKSSSLSRLNQKRESQNSLNGRMVWLKTTRTYRSTSRPIRARTSPKVLHQHRSHRER